VKVCCGTSGIPRMFCDLYSKDIPDSCEGRVGAGWPGAERAMRPEKGLLKPLYVLRCTGSAESF
jgi:hypothetical protein